MTNKGVFRLTVDMDNAAFEDNPNELTDILEQAIKKIKEGNTTAKLKDTNGNTVGVYTTW